MQDSMSQRLFVFRHGETDWNKIKKLQGLTDTALNDTGREQALVLADALRVDVLSSLKD
jgi:broad specificity phosphatase PhoE